MKKSLLLLAGLAFWISAAAVVADDKDLLKKGTAPPNILIVFGNSQTTEQPIQGSTSAWDGDADSPASKLGAAKAVIKQFILQEHSNFNIGLTGFSHGSDAGSVRLQGKHWLYSPLTDDFPHQTWKEPAGTIERWGVLGEGPCTSVTKLVPTDPPGACMDRSSSITLPSGVAGAVGPFFGPQGAGTAYIYLDGTVDSKGNPKNATKRIQVTLTMGKYGDAFQATSTGVDFSTYANGGTHSMEVTKVYQVKSGSSWVTGSGLSDGDASTVTVQYVPSSTLTRDLFYTTKPGNINAPCVAGDQACGNEIGFLNDNPLAQDVSTGASCGGWEFQKNSAQLPLVKIPRDYKWGANCAPPQDSLLCFNRLMRPQARLVSYDQGTGLFAPSDYDNPGYTTTSTDVPGDYADGCDRTLLGAVDASLNVVGRQAVLETTPNGAQAPIKNLLQNVLDYFTKPAIDGFQKGVRTDDPNKACRKSGVILIYDTFNACQNDNCSTLTTQVLTTFKQVGVPVYVIGFGKGVGKCVDTTCSGFCIAQNSGAVLSDGVTPGYFSVSNASGLFQTLINIASILDQSPQTFATTAVSTTQAQGGQMAFFGSFSPTKSRSIWNGRLAGYELGPTGAVQLGQFTITDPNDPNNGAVIPVPSNASVISNPTNPSLIWNAAQNLAQTPGTGATDSSAVLAPGAGISTGSYVDQTNDGPGVSVPTSFYPGRKIVFSLPQGYTTPTSLPIPNSKAVPESRFDMTRTTAAPWWPALKALLGPQTSPPAVLAPALADDDAGDSLRFIWGDRDAVTGATDAGHQYLGQKLGDVFHSGPLIVGRPNDFAFFVANVQNYRSFFSTYQNRRRVLFVGANDGLLHAFDAGAFNRNTTNAYDLGTGAELFAFAPRAILQIYKPLKDAVGPQTKRDEWTVDLSPSAADVFIGPINSSGNLAGSRTWRTVLVSGVREGSPFEGTSGASPQDSQGSYFALDITQPDELTGNPAVENPGTLNAPKCLNAAGDTPPGDASCAQAWPTVLWEITDSCGSPCTAATGDLDAAGSPGFGYPDMGETWSKPAMGRVKVCTANCGTSSATNEDHYVAIFGGGFDRERKNRRGNWLYMVDIETGMTLYKVNSSCGGDPIIPSCNTPTYFGSIPSGPTAVDFNGDGYLDLIYVGDLKGQLWRIDLTNLQKLKTAPGGRFHNQLDLAAGSGVPFLFFQAPQPTPPATTPFYPMYNRPDTINLGYNVNGRPALGIAFGTGDRDDILATVDPSSLTYNQRFYYVVDAANTVTKTETDLTDIPTPTNGVCSGGPNAGAACTSSGVCGTGGTCSAVTTTVSASGWFLELCTPTTGSCQSGERVVGDTLTVGGIIRFPTFNPFSSKPAGDACGNVAKCTSAAGTSRLYSVFYNNGNAYPVGSSDRGQTQANATFITAVTGYIGGSGEGGGLYWSGGAQNPSLGTGRKITVRSWKEKTSIP